MEFKSIVVFLENELPPYLNDVPEIIRAFSPYILVSKDASNLVFKLNLINVAEKNASFLISLGVIEKTFILPYSDNPYNPSMEMRSKIKSYIKRMLYLFCNEITMIELPYGSLTGVRPTRVYYANIGIHSNIIQHLIEDLFVAKDRAQLIENVVKNQNNIYLRSDNSVDLFLNIPICKTKCKYCSFSTSSFNNVEKMIPLYIECMIIELENALKYIAAKNLVLRSVYVGGGTPTSISNEQLERLLSRLSFGVEFTVEAGRPDSITNQNLEILSKCGVTRISINPQTFNQITLNKIGRNHNISSIYESFILARAFKFDINMDLIAGLPGESFDMFQYSMLKAIELNPENITVHTLAVKKGSEFRNEGYQKAVSGEVKIMADYSRYMLCKSNYVPYYMYRQKNMADNLENVGYCLPGKQCIYNVDFMEETNTVLGIGAGATTKYIFNEESRMERKYNKKDIMLYCQNFSKN